MPFYRVITKRAHVRHMRDRSGLDEMEAIIPAEDAMHARDKAIKMFHRDVLETEEIEFVVSEFAVSIKPKRRRG